MIRKFTQSDIDAVLDIWLTASIDAHNFVEADFWRDQISNMRDVYIPASEVYVFELNGDVVGFYALYEDSLAAIFVYPDFQGQGLGEKLITHAKSRRDSLTLSVYKDNQASYQFYLSQGFKVISEQTDEHTGYPEYTMTN
ncbi:putative Acetyltransferase [Vibrio nigripulchritudo SOn1]|uniref:Acetyltransferase n=1 Tax=Vibrio nigripulchritudo SOn1 TaxID=1238450 RepID=A0AAV2VUT9_9VIBR|nr:N-acetyltransferase [Vibrio nigripulchritudo]CCO48169.1 putative Acetyltransferase [Vibrio nigripulchritudo SOn1]